MEITNANSGVCQVIREIFGHLLGQRCDENSFILVCPLTDFFHEVIDLAFRRFNHDLGVDETCGANDLFDIFTTSGFQLVVAGGGGHVHALAFTRIELIPCQRPVIDGAR